jgi:hypothetical protein
MKKIVLTIIIGILVISSFGACGLSLKNPSKLKFIDEYDMVIIAPDMFSNALQPLITHKDTVGIKSFLKTTEEIYNEYSGRDRCEMIKYFIKETYETNNISYVFLIGAIDLLPMRIAKIKWYGSDNESLIVSDIITDMYYADIYDGQKNFCSWDTNNNNEFGEAIFYTVDEGDAGFTIDEVDLYPDIGIGRVLCKNIRQIKNIVEKIISYENNDINKNWFQNMLLIGGDQYVQSPKWDPYKLMEGEIVINQISEIMSSFNHIKLCTSDGSFSVKNFNNEINKGIGFIAYSGHGFEYGLGLHPPEDEEFIMYYTPFLFGLRNEDKYPIVYLHACLTAKTDFSFLGMRLPCFAWSMVKKPQSGAIAVIGSTRTGFSYTTEIGAQEGGSRLMVEFFKHCKPGSILSEVFNDAKKDYLNQVWDDVDDCITIEEYNLIGDPSLRIGGYH